MGKRICAAVLCILMLLCAVPVQAQGQTMTVQNERDWRARSYGLMDENDQMATFDYQVPEDGAAVLIFFDMNAAGSQELFWQLEQCDWTASPYLDIVAVEQMSCHGAFIGESLRGFKNTYAPTKGQYIDCFYSGNGQPAWNYAISMAQSSEDSLKITFPMVVVITQTGEEYTIRYGDEGMTSADKLYNSLCAVSEGFAATTTHTTPTEPLPQVVKPGELNITRLAGSDRYQTSQAAARELREQMGGGMFSSVIVASGSSFPDALAGSYLAAVRSAPILLAKPGEELLLQMVIREILTPGGTVYLLGGEAAVSQKMEENMEDFTVKRLGGSDRYETNLLILQEAGVAGKDMVVCTGKNFADSLSASALGLPILLVKGELNSRQRELLQAASGTKYIIGGKNAVSEKVESQLASYGAVRRIAGNTRYETSALVAEHFFPAPGQVVLAYGKNFPDGLSGGPLACRLGAPLLLTQAGSEEAAAEYVTGKGLLTGYVLGGTAVLTEKTVQTVFGAA